MLFADRLWNDKLSALEENIRKGATRVWLLPGTRVTAGVEAQTTLLADPDLIQWQRSAQARRQPGMQLPVRFQRPFHMLNAHAELMSMRRNVHVHVARSTACA